MKRKSRLKKNDPGIKSMRIMKKKQKKREKDLKKKNNKINVFANKKKQSNEDEEKLNKVAYELSRRFSYSKLSQAVDGKGGYEVHGYMEKSYLNYEWLIDKMVLDRACFYAKKEHIPEIILFTNEIDIKNYHRCVVEASQEITFENYPTFPFKKLILYSRTPIDEGINWLDNYPWVLEGYDTFIQLGPANLALLGWATWNIPVCIVLHAPGKNQALFNAKVSASDLRSEKEEQLKNFIYQYRTQMNIIEEKLDEIQLESLQYQKLYSDLKRTVLSGSPVSSAEEFRNFEKKAMKKNPRGFKIDKRTGLWIVGILIVAVLLIWIMMSITFPPITTIVQTEPGTSSLIVFNIKGGPPWLMI